jgi:ketosteroid isomerase-like protein
MLRTGLATLLLSVAALCGIASAQDLTPDQKGVWERELAYCRYLQNGDLDGYMSLWDEDFVGWPNHDPAPVTKADIRKEVATEIKSGVKVICNPVLRKVNVLGDIAATFYVLELSTTKKDGSAENSKPRITHTWRKRNGEWKIVAGMSAAEQH